MRCVIYLRVSTERQARRDGCEEGFSIPAQREACVRHIADHGWELADEYVDRGESARSADRPQLQAMLARVGDDRNIDAVVVHKVDRLARNIEDHVAIRAALRRNNVTLVSVTENLEETASGRLVEGIHAVMAEFYSANLSTEIRKGLSQKAKQGGWPHAAPLGYLNLRELVGGRQVARIVRDPDRAPLIREAFQLYATGEWTLQRLRAELEHRGLRGRPRDGEAKPMSLNGLSTILRSKVYAGIVEWHGVESQVRTTRWSTSRRSAKSRSCSTPAPSGGTRERKHHHYLKGLLHCGVCGRRLSVQHSKGHYLYFFCLGQKSDRTTTCREPYVPADRVEDEIAKLYQRLQLPDTLIARVRTEIEKEIARRQRGHAAEHKRHTRQLDKLDAQRRKLLDAYYTDAIDVNTLKKEQERLTREARVIQDRLDAIDGHCGDWQEILDLALKLAARCGKTYANASDKTKKLLNTAVLNRVEVRDGHVTGWEAREPFDELFNGPEFEYGSLVELTGIEPATSCVQSRRSAN